MDLRALLLAQVSPLSPQASSGDSASAFFSSGQIEAARGGTGIDTSASTGTPQITAGTWSVVPIAYATIWETDDAGTSTIDTGAVGTFVPWTTATSVTKSSNVTADVSDVAGSSITVPATGIYAISFGTSFSGTGNSTMKIATTIDGTASTDLRIFRKLGAGGDVGSASHPFSFWSLTANQKIRLAFDSDGISDTVTIFHIALSMFRIA